MTPGTCDSMPVSTVRGRTCITCGFSLVRTNGNLLVTRQLVGGNPGAFAVS